MVPWLNRDNLPRRAFAFWLISEWAGTGTWDAAESILPDEQLRLDFLEETARQLHQKLSRVEHWAAIAALADELQAHETLEAEQTLEVLVVWMH